MEGEGDHSSFFLMKFLVSNYVGPYEPWPSGAKIQNRLISANRRCIIIKFMLFGMLCKLSKYFEVFKYEI